MRVLWTATMAASALAIGLGTHPAQSLPLGDKIAGPDAMVQQVQRGERYDGYRGRERGYQRDRDRRRDGFYFGIGPRGPSFGYGPQRRDRGYDGYRGRDRGYYDGYRRRDY